MRRSAREFFEEVRAAARDAERCKRQLDALEARMRSIGGGGYEPRIQTSDDPDKMGRRVGAYVDAEARYGKRIEEDYRLIDAACVVLYGEDQIGDGGLCKVKSGAWADVLWWRYCADETWSTLARNMNFSVRQCQMLHGKALAWMDRNRYMSRIIDGEGGSEEPI